MPTWSENKEQERIEAEHFLLQDEANLYYSIPSYKIERKNEKRDTIPDKSYL